MKQILALGLALFHFSSFAQTPDEPAPAADAADLTVITSDRLEYDAPNRMARFDRNVVVRDPNLQLKADRLTVLFNEDNTVRLIRAEGTVEIVQEDKKAWAESAVYNMVTGEIVMEGNPRVMRGRDMLTAKKITFWRNENRLVCEPDAKLVIHPDKKLGPDFLRGGF